MADKNQQLLGILVDVKAKAEVQDSVKGLQSLADIIKTAVKNSKELGDSFKQGLKFDLGSKSVESARANLVNLTQQVILAQAEVKGLDVVLASIQNKTLGGLTKSAVDAAAALSQLKTTTQKTRLGGLESLISDESRIASLLDSLKNKNSQGVKAWFSAIATEIGTGTGKVKADFNTFFTELQNSVEKAVSATPSKNLAEVVGQQLRSAVKVATTGAIPYVKSDLEVFGKALNQEFAKVLITFNQNDPAGFTSIIEKIQAALSGLKLIPAEISTLLGPIKTKLAEELTRLFKFDASGTAASNFKEVITVALQAAFAGTNVKSDFLEKLINDSFKSAQAAAVKGSENLSKVLKDAVAQLKGIGVKTLDSGIIPKEFFDPAKKGLETLQQSVSKFTQEPFAAALALFTQSFEALKKAATGGDAVNSLKGMSDATNILNKAVGSSTAETKELTNALALLSAITNKSQAFAITNELDRFKNTATTAQTSANELAQKINAAFTTDASTFKKADIDTFSLALVKLNEIYDQHKIKIQQSIDGYQTQKILLGQYQKQMEAFAGPGGLSKEQKNSFSVQNASLDAAIKSFEALKPALEQGRQGWQNAANSALLTKESVTSLSAEFDLAAGNVNKNSVNFFNALTKVAGAASILNSEMGAGTAGFVAFQERFNGVAVSSNELTNTLRQAQIAFKDLFTEQGRLGKPFDLSNITQAVEKLKTIGADPQKSKIFEDYSQQLAVLVNFVRIAKLENTEFGKSINNLFENVTKIGAFENGFRNLTESLRNQESSVTKLSNSYGTIFENLQKLTNLEDKLKTTPLGETRNKLLREEAELRQKLTGLIRDYARQEQASGKSQALIINQLNALQKQSGELGITRSFASATLAVENLNSILNSTVGNFQKLDLTSKGFGTQLTGGLKTAESELTAVSNKITTLLTSLATKVNTELLRIGANPTVSGNIKTALENLINVIKSGGDVSAAFATLKIELDNGFKSLEAQGKGAGFIKIFEGMRSGLSNVTTQLGSDFTILSNKYASAFEANTPKVEAARQQIVRLQESVVLASSALNTLDATAKNTALSKQLSDLKVNANGLKESIRGLEKPAGGVLSPQQEVTLASLQRRLKEVTAEYNALNNAAASSGAGSLTGLQTKQYEAVGLAIRSMGTELKALGGSDVIGVLDNRIQRLQERFSNLLGGAGFGQLQITTALTSGFEAAGIDAATIFKAAFGKNLKGIDPRDITTALNNAISDANRSQDKDLANTLTRMLNKWKVFADEVVKINGVIGVAGQNSLAFLRDTTATGGSSALNPALTALQTQIVASTAEAGRLRSELIGLLGGSGADGKQLVENFVALKNSSQAFRQDLGQAKVDLALLDNITTKLKLPAGDPLLAILQQIRTEIQGVVASGKELERQTTSQFVNNMESLVNLTGRSNNLLAAFTTQAKEITSGDLFGKPARDINLAYNNLQLLQTALRTVQNQLSNQTRQGTLGGADDATRAAIEAQVKVIGQAVTEASRYNQVLEQLRSSAKLEVFNRMSESINQVATSLANTAKAGQTFTPGNIAVAWVQELTQVRESYLATSKSIIDGSALLSTQLVDDAKKAGNQSKQTAQDLQAWLNVLRSLKDAGQLTTNIGGMTFNVAPLITQIEAMLTAFNGIPKAVDATNKALDTRLNSVLGQLEIRAEAAITKFNTLKSSINGVSSAAIQSGSGFQTIRQMMNELNKPMDVNNKFFTMGKDVYAPLRVELSAYTEGLKASLNSVRAFVNSVEGTRDAAAIASPAYQRAVLELKQLQTAFNEASAASTKFNQYGKEANEFTPLNAQLGGAAGSMKALLERGALLSHGMQKFFSFIAKSSGQLNVIPANAKLAIEAFKALEQQMVRFRSGIIQWTMGVQMAGQAMLDPFKKATAGFIDFSDRMGIIASVSNALTSEFYELKNAAILMGATTRFTTEQAAEGLEKLARAGFNVQQQLEMLPSVMRLAQAAATDLATAAEISTIVMNEFRMDPSQFAEATDVLALAANRTQATVSDLGFGFKYIGALAANVGADFSDLTASLALLHNAGMKGTMAGTALRGMMQRLMNPTKESAELIRDLSDRIGGAGLVLQDARGNFVGFSSILQQLEKAGITTAETLKIFGQRAGPGMAALLAMGSDKLKELEEDLENSAGTAARMADTMEKTFKGQLLLMRSAFSALSDSVGMNLSKTLMPLAATMADLTNKFIALRNAFPGLTAVMDTGLASIALFAATLGAVAVAWSMIIIPTIQFIGMLKTVAATFFIATGAMAASTTATAVNTVATGINTGSKIANAAATGAVAGAQSAVVVSTNAATGAIVAQTVALNANAAASARMILSAVFSAKGLATIGRFLVTNPWGIAITAIGTIAALTLAQSKSTEIVNVELQKQREILEANRREMEILGNKAAATADRIQLLQARLDAAQGNERLSANIELDLKANEAQYQAQLREIFNRLTDQNSAFKTEFVPIVDLDPVTGEFKSFQVQIVGTATAFDLLGGSIRERSTDLRGLVNVMNEVGKARDQALSLDKIKNIGDQVTGQYSFWQQINPFNRDDFVSLGRDIAYLEKRLPILQRIRDEFAKPVAERDNTLFVKLAQDFKRFQNLSSDINILPSFNVEGMNSQVEKVYIETLNKLNELKPKHQKLVESFAKILADHYDSFTEEQKRKFDEMEPVDQTALLQNLSPRDMGGLSKLWMNFFGSIDAETGLYEDVVRFRKQMNDAAAMAVQIRREAQEKAQKELAEIKPINVNQAGGLLGTLGDALKGAEEQIKDSLDSQKDLIEKGKTLIGEIEKFQSIMTEAFAADLTLKLGKVTFEEGTDVDRLKAEFDAFASKLEIESKVVELPLSAKIKDLGKVGASTFSALDRFNTGILSYERQFNQKLFSAREDFESKNKSRLLQSLKEQEDAITAHLAKVGGLYKDGDNINNLREQQNQLSALRRIKEEEYQIAKSSYDRQAQVLRDLAQKEKSITDDRLSIIDRIAKAQKTLQERGEDKKLSDTEAELEARAAKAEELGNAWLAARLRRQAVVEKERLESQREYQLRSQLLALEQQLTKELRTQKAAGSEGDFDRAKALRDELLSFAESAAGSIEPGGYLDSIIQRVLINLGKSTETIDAGLKTQAQAQRTALESGMAAEQTAMQQSIQDLKQIDKELEDLVTKIQNIRIGEEIAVNVSTTEAYAKLRNFADEFKKTIRELDKQKILIDVAIAQQTDFDELREGATTAQATQARIVKLTDAYKELQKQQDRVASNQNPITNFKALDDAMRKVISTIANLSGGKINAPLAKNLQQETSAMTTLITGLKSDIKSSNLTPDLQKLMLGVVEAYEKGINDINTVISRGDNTTDLARNLREGLENAIDAVDQGEKELQDVLRNYDVLLIKLAALGIEVNKFLSGEGIGTGDDSREIATNNLRDFSQLAERMIELYRKMAQESDLSLERKAELSQLEAIARQFTLNQELTEDQVEFLNKIIELRRQEAEAIQRSNEIVKNSASFDPSAYSAKTGLALANVGELPPGAAEQARAAGRELVQEFNEGVNQVTATGETLGDLNKGLDRSLSEASDAIKSANLGSDLAASFEGQEFDVPVPELDLASLTPNAGELAALGNNIVAPLAAPIARGIGTAIAESLAADAIIRGVEGLGTWIQEALSPPPLKVDTVEAKQAYKAFFSDIPESPLVKIEPEIPPGSSEAVGAALVAGAANGVRGASVVLEQAFADIINRLAQTTSSAAIELGTVLAATIAAGLSAATGGAVVNVPAKVKVDDSELAKLKSTAFDVPATVKVEDSELAKLKSTAFDVPVAPVIKPKTPEEVRHAFIGGQELKVPVDMVTTEVVDMAGVEAQGAEYSRRFRENAEAQGIRMRVDSAVITHDINGVDQQLKSFTATDREIPLDIKSELIKRELTEIDQLLQQAQARRGPPQSAADIAMYAEADKQAINAKMRAVERIKALSDEAARAEYASHQQTTASANQAATAQIAANERVASNATATQQQITTATNQAATAQIAAAQQVEANAPVVEIDFKAELLRQGLLEIDQMLQQAQARRKQYESVSQHAMNTEADKQAINAQMRLREQVAAMDQETARKKLEANQQAAAQLTESIANMERLKALSDINPITVDTSAQNLVGEIQADLERLKQSGATNIKVSLDSESGQLVVTADVSQANEQVGAILEKINSSSTVLKLDITAATAQTQALKAMIDRTTANRTIYITYVERNKPSGAQNRQHGGIIHRMAGGLIPVQKFAAGGIAKFKKLLSPIVPGSGTGDRVPAMLEPGEFVIRKKAVQSLGTDFLNLLNSGLIQFKNLGGMVESLPLNTLRNLSNMVGSTPTTPQLATDGGGTVNINLKIGDKNFNMKKIPRDQVSQLTNALSYLGRGL